MHVFRYSLFLFTAMLLLPAVVRLQAQQPSPPVQRVFHYQGCLTDASGVKIDGQRTIRFEIVDLDSSPLAVLFSETVQSLQVEDGIFEHAIGSVDTTNNPLPPLIFQKRVALRLTVDGETLNPPIPIYPAPVAMVALYADSLKQPLPEGPRGPAGPPGADGISCWDLNGNGMKDLATEDINGDGVVDVADCQGPMGPRGPRGPAGANGKDGKDGINCWDTNGNGVKDPGEDTNGDGVWDASDCKGPKGDPGPPGGVGDTIVVEDLTVTGRSMHEGNEHFRRGITVGGQDSARAKLRIDSTGEIYARSMHIIDPDVSGLYDFNRVVEFDSSGSVHRMPERYITFNPRNPQESDTTVVRGDGISTPAVRIVNPHSGEEIARLDTNGSWHHKPEYFISQNPQDPTQRDTTVVTGSGVSSRGFVTRDPATGMPSAVIAPDGEGYFRSLHLVDSTGSRQINFNRNGQSEFFRLVSFMLGLRILLETGAWLEFTPFGMFLPLTNGYIMELSPFDGFSIKDPNAPPSNQYIAHIDPNGNSLFTGQKNALVSTESYGMRKMYVEESTELWFSDRGFGKLEDGEIRIALDPMFLETAHVDDAHPIHVRLTPTAQCNGLYVAEKGEDYFIVRELMDGTSDATFDWEVNAKRRNYEDARMEEFTAPESGAPREVTQ